MRLLLRAFVMKCWSNDVYIAVWATVPLVLLQTITIAYIVYGCHWMVSCPRKNRIRDIERTPKMDVLCMVNLYQVLKVIKSTWNKFCFKKSSTRRRYYVNFWFDNKRQRKARGVLVLCFKMFSLNQLFQSSLIPKHLHHNRRPSCRMTSRILPDSPASRPLGSFYFHTWNFSWQSLREWRKQSNREMSQTEPLYWKQHLLGLAQLVQRDLKSWGLQL